MKIISFFLNLPFWAKCNSRPDPTRPDDGDATRRRQWPNAKPIKKTQKSNIFTFRMSLKTQKKLLSKLYIFQKHVAKLVDITSEKCKITSNLKCAKIYKLHPIWDVISPETRCQNRHYYIRKVKNTDPKRLGPYPALFVSSSRVFLTTFQLIGKHTT